MEQKLYRICLGKQLRDYRKKRNISHVFISETCGISRPALRRIEAGSGNIASFVSVLSALDLTLTGKQFPGDDKLGIRFTQLRHKHNTSQRQLADTLGVSQPTIIALERRSTGRLSLLNKILNHFKTDVHLTPYTASRHFSVGAAVTRNSDEWYSPQWLLETLYDCLGGGFDLDPCSPAQRVSPPPVKAKRYYTIDDDGLSLPWNGDVYMNPPYSHVDVWVAKARRYVEAKTSRTVIGLVPARTDTQWWHDNVAGHAHVFFLKGRLKFSEQKSSAPFPSAVILWGGDIELVAKLKTSLNAFHMAAE